MLFNWRMETINICFIIELYVLIVVIMLLTLGGGVFVFSVIVCVCLQISYHSALVMPSSLFI